MMRKQFHVSRYRGESINLYPVVDPDHYVRWNNPVDIVRAVMGAALGIIPPGVWTEYTLIPESCGENGWWSVRDLSGRTTVVADVEFLRT